MSVQAMTWVLEHSPTKGTDRLVLLALANHAPKDPVNGAWECWPGVALIAREAGLERQRTAQESLARLVEMGAVNRVLNGAPLDGVRRDRRPNLYRILTAHGVTESVTPTGVGSDSRGDAGADPVDGSRGDASQQNGVTDSGVTGCREASPKSFTTNRQVNRGSAREPQPGLLILLADEQRKRRDAEAAAEGLGDTKGGLAKARAAIEAATAGESS